MGFLQKTIGERDWDHIATFTEEQKIETYQSNLLSLYREAKKFYMCGGVITGDEWAKLDSDEVAALIQARNHFGILSLFKSGMCYEVQDTLDSLLDEESQKMLRDSEKRPDPKKRDPFSQ